MIAIGYARLSKTSEKSVSIEYQIAAIRKLAQEKGYDLTSIEVDNNISGKFLVTRPGVQRVLDAVTSNKVNAVLVYRSDRLSRNGIEGLVVRELFEKHNVTYLSSTEGILRYDIMGFVQEGMSREERIKIASRTREALQLKKAKGERVGSQLPYGYKVISGNVVEVPQEQNLLSRVRELRSAGLSSYKIASQINLEGYTTRKSTPFSRTQIVRMLGA